MRLFLGVPICANPDGPGDGFLDKSPDLKYNSRVDTETDLILEAKGTYTITGGSNFNWQRTHLWNGTEWIHSEASGVFVLSLDGDNLKMESEDFCWVLNRK